VDELNSRVRHLCGIAVNGFVDTQELKGGEEWRAELVDALCSSQTLVCLYSPSYFASKACGKEMQVFLERRRLHIKQSPGKKPANIIPVIWHPCQTIPASIPDFQYRLAPELDPKTYGLWNLLDERKEKPFRAAMHEMALRVREAWNKAPLPPLQRRAVFGGIQSAFDAPLIPLSDFDSPTIPGGPHCVTFVYPTRPPWNIWPYAPPETNAMLPIAASVAIGLDYFPCQLTFDIQGTDLIGRLRTVLRQNNIVLILVDGKSLTNDGLRQRFRELDEQHSLDRQHFKDTSTLVVWPDDIQDDRRVVKNTLRYLNTHRAPHFYPEIRSPQQLRDAVYECIEVLRMRKLNDPDDPRPLPAAGGLPRL
jgi:hypothetical protein